MDDCVTIFRTDAVDRCDVYCDWFECPWCGTTRIAYSFHYCPMCGRPICWEE